VRHFGFHCRKPYNRTCTLVATTGALLQGVPQITELFYTEILRFYGCTTLVTTTNNECPGIESR